MGLVPNIGVAKSKSFYLFATANCQTLIVHSIKKAYSSKKALKKYTISSLSWVLWQRGRGRM